MEDEDVVLVGLGDDIVIQVMKKVWFFVIVEDFFVIYGLVDYRNIVCKRMLLYLVKEQIWLMVVEIICVVVVVGYVIIEKNKCVMVGSLLIDFDIREKILMCY